jgi:cyclopropane fatty-acyl-phospholipid synthase-like methyltransferase
MKTSLTNAVMLSEISNYYTEKIIKHGLTPQGVDWNGEDGQRVRFQQLCRIINIQDDRFSLNDLGSGYGALFDYLSHKYGDFSYLGVDISREMIQAAQQRYLEIKSARFLQGSQPDQIADYAVASGIFNVRLGRGDDEWYEYLTQTLDVLDQSSHVGFAFNCLTSYSDEDKKRDYLYYADPCRLFDLCKQRYSKKVALLHDYGLYEFTILVRKTA